MSVERARWLREVGRFTARPRYHRARVHEDKADKAPRRSTLEFWHRSRATALRERIERVEKCSTELAALMCKGCGQIGQPIPKRCAGWRYCVVCRGARAERYRARFEEARAAWLRQSRGFERERFLTLTMPHTDKHVQYDVRMILDAWERFIRSLRRWLARTQGHRRIAYVRCLEVTPSDGGHAHLHAWIGSTFLPHAVLRVLWGRCLSADMVPVRPLAEVLAELPDERSKRELERVSRWRGRVRAFVPWPVLDIRAATSNVGSELIKYMLKEIEGGALIEPELAATLIEATEQTRTVAANRHFWVLVEQPCDCGDTHRVLMKVVLPASTWTPGGARDP